MFTGIIMHMGRFIKQNKEGFIFEVPPNLAKQITTGLSIAIDGVCLTVKKKINTTIYVDVMEETLKKTILGNLKSKSLVNLELPVTTETFFSGHIIQGHIDEVARLKGVLKKGNSYILRLSIPNNLSKYIVKKGSIAVNGISLTVIEAGKNYFTVGIVPYTWDKTMLHIIKTGDFVNIEVDILAKYVDRFLQQ